QPDIYRVNNQQNIWLKSVKCCIQDEQGQVLNSNYFIDVSETIDLSKQNQDLEAQLADNIPTDKLTGLLNRKSLLNALERQVSRSRRYSNPLSVIIVRLHHWQASHDDSAATINDALTAIAFDLRDQMRWVDLIGRTDDQEFTLILPETASDDASHLAEKIRKRLLDLSHPDKPEMQLKISLKAGVTSWRKGDDIRLLYARALEAAESAEQEENKNIITL
ncbi:MAG: GGDEF domain-containing protein, partial [Gammaproteobacteria bacterium]|nr:GGDEF domain-containing protein [Gammaproteobacteria bacterium]